ncbi:MAG: cytochrome ubiquinol oxidase subunit I [Phycisphaerae bacterium]
MEALGDPVVLSRLQFAVTTLFHMLWPLLTIGISLFLVLMEALWLLTGQEDYFRHVRFWAGLLLLSFGIGVASGLPLEFEFGTNWAKFSRTSGGFFGNILGFEGAMAFMLEAVFLGIMMFGWKRVSRGTHLFSTVMVALGASLSAFWIMDASSWMQTPAGVSIEDGQTTITNYAAAVFNPSMGYSLAHKLAACLETSLFFVGGISAWYLLEGLHTEFFLKSFKASLALAIAVAPLQIWLGDLSGRGVARYQPAKAAAMESHWQTNPPGQGAPLALLAWPDEAAERNAWAVEVPGMLSLLATRTADGQVVGLKDFQPQDRPPIVLPFYALRIMVAIGVLMFLLMLWTLWRWARGRLTPRDAGGQRWLMRSWIAFVPMGFVATDLGWVLREVGRQPWVIYNVMRTSDGASNLHWLPPAVTLALYTLIYALLLAAFFVYAGRIIRKGPDLSSGVPKRGIPRLGSPPVPGGPPRAAEGGP